MNKISCLLAGIVAVITLAFSSQASEGIEADLVKAANDMNRKRAVMRSQDLQLDRVTTKGKTLTYHIIAFTSLQKLLENPATREWHVKSLKQKNAIDSSMKVLFQSGVSLEYRYSNSDGKLIYSFVMTPADCGY